MDPDSDPCLQLHKGGIDDDDDGEKKSGPPHFLSFSSLLVARVFVLHPHAPRQFSKFRRRIRYRNLRGCVCVCVSRGTGKSEKRKKKKKVEMSEQSGVSCSAPRSSSSQMKT